jgi:hypothetical protein
MALSSCAWPTVVHAHDERPCDIRALQAVDQISDWNDLYDQFKQYAHCEDGALDEGWSDVVVRLLTKDWKSVSVLSRLTDEDAKLSDFVLFHVNELMSPDDARTIVANARTKCPKDARRICDALADKAALF